LEVHAQPTIFEPLLAEPVNKYLSELFKVNITSHRSGAKSKICCRCIIVDAAFGINRQIARVAITSGDASHC